MSSSNFVSLQVIKVRQDFFLEYPVVLTLKTLASLTEKLEADLTLIRKVFNQRILYFR